MHNRGDDLLPQWLLPKELRLVDHEKREKHHEKQCTKEQPGRGVCKNRIHRRLPLLVLLFIELGSSWSGTHVFLAFIFVIRGHGRPPPTAEARTISKSGTAKQTTGRLASFVGDRRRIQLTGFLHGASTSIPMPLRGHASRQAGKG